jgi:hypothetical protein
LWWTMFGAIAWDSFCLDNIMRVLGQGSMVLVTSREHGAARELQGTREEEVECLPDEQSMELFCKYAFPGVAQAPSSWMEYIGLSRWAAQILAVLKMCAGLPMALEVVGRYFAACEDKGMFRTCFQEACSKPLAGRKEEERSLLGRAAAELEHPGA